MADGRDPARAALAVAGVVALILSSGLLPAFAGAAPGGDLFRDLGSFGLEPDTSGFGDPGLGDPGIQDPGVQAPEGALSFLRDLFGAGDGSRLTRDPEATDPGGGDPSGSPSDGGGGGGPPLLEWLSDLSFGDGGDDGEATPRGDPAPCTSPQGAGAYTVCFENRLVPGTETVVSVYRDGDPAAGVELLVNGEPAGRTDRTGRVRVEVPYTDRITVSVRQGDLAPPDDSVADLTPSEESPADLAVSGSVPAPGDGRAYSLSAPTGSAVPTRLDERTRQRSQSGNGSASAPVETRISIDVQARDGDPSPGAEAAVRATVERSPVADATVYIDGERAGVTRQGGVAVVDLPVARSVNVTVVRGAARGRRQVTLAVPRIRANGPLGLALPGSDATVVVTDDGAPVENATVSVAGERVGRTDRNGTVAATLPLAPLAGVGTQFPSGLTASRTLHLWLVPLVGLLAVGLLAGVAVGVHRRTERSGRDAAAELGATFRAVASDLVSALVGLAEAFEETAAAIGDRLRAALAGLSLPGLDAVRNAVGARIRAIGAALLTALRWPLRRLRGDEPQQAPGSGAAAGGPTAAGTDTEFEGARGRIRRAWRGLVERAAVARPDTATPGQVAGRALSQELPREPVARLTDAFRAVEYGGEDPERHVEGAERAAAELEGPVADGSGAGEPAGHDGATDEPTDGGDRS